MYILPFPPTNNNNNNNKIIINLPSESVPTPITNACFQNSLLSCFVVCFSQKHIKLLLKYDINMNHM